MKHLKYLICLLGIAFTLYSCSSDDDNNGGNGNGTTSGEANTNRNVVTTDAAVARLEFPKLKGGNSIVLVHRTTRDRQYDRDEVNYCVEWDCDKKAQRWSCYQMHRGYTGSYSRVVDGYLFDPNLTTSQYLDKDYFYGSGFDHGHICPNADRKYSYKRTDILSYQHAAAIQAVQRLQFVRKRQGRGSLGENGGKGKKLVASRNDRHALRLQGWHDRQGKQHHQENTGKAHRSKVFLHGMPAQKQHGIPCHSFLGRAEG